HPSAVRREPYRGFGVAEKTWGRPAMASPAYFRRQADICLRLSLISSDGEVSNRLIIMAREYAAKADALEETAADLPSGDRTHRRMPGGTMRGRAWRRTPPSRPPSARARAQTPDRGSLSGQTGKHSITLSLATADPERLEAWYHPSIA